MTIEEFVDSIEKEIDVKYSGYGSIREIAYLSDKKLKPWTCRLGEVDTEFVLAVLKPHNKKYFKVYTLHKGKKLLWFDEDWSGFAPPVFDTEFVYEDGAVWYYANHKWFKFRLS